MSYVFGGLTEEQVRASVEDYCSHNFVYSRSSNYKELYVEVIYEYIDGWFKNPILEGFIWDYVLAGIFFACGDEDNNDQYYQYMLKHFDITTIKDIMFYLHENDRDDADIVPLHDQVIVPYARLYKLCEIKNTGSEYILSGIKYLPFSESQKASILVKIVSENMSYEEGQILEAYGDYFCLRPTDLLSCTARVDINEIRRWIEHLLTT